MALTKCLEYSLLGTFLTFRRSDTMTVAQMNILLRQSISKIKHKNFRIAPHLLQPDLESQK